MTIKFTKELPENCGYDYKTGDVVENAEDIFGITQTKYFLDTGHAEAVKEKTEKATTK